MITWLRGGGPENEPDMPDLRGLVDAKYTYGPTIDLGRKPFDPGFRIARKF